MLRAGTPVLLGLLFACSDRVVVPPVDPPFVGDSTIIGPLVGRVGPDRATIWARVDRSVSLSVRYSSDSALTGYTVSAPTILDALADYTAKIELTGLLPETTYYYDILIDGASVFRAPFPQFRTFPPVVQAEDFKVVKLTDFCCFDVYSPPPSGAFAAASAEHPAFVLIGGDFDHRNPQGSNAEDARRLKRQMYRDLYARTPNTDGFVQGILRRYPVAHMWDDHDFASNNADKSYRFKAVSLDVLKEYFPTYDTGLHGDWQKFRYAQAEFFLLDSRSQRDHSKEPDGPRKSMLDGSDLRSVGQLRWLKDALRASSATWKFLVSPVVFNPTVPKDDGWTGYQREREELVAFIRSNRIRNVVVVSGDIHAGAIDDGQHSSFPEMVVPAANLAPSDASCLSAPGTGDWSIGSYGDNSVDSCPGYGLITVLRDPDRVILEVKDETGRARLSHTVLSNP